MDVEFEKTATGWLGTVEELRIRVAGRSLEEARRLVADHTGSAELSEQFVLPSVVADAVARARKLKSQAVEFDGAAKVAVAYAASLLAEHKFSLRDAGMLLGMSHTAVDKLAAAYTKQKLDRPRIQPQIGEFALVVPVAHDRVDVVLADAPTQPGDSLLVGHRVRVVDLRHVPGATLAVVDPLNDSPLVQMSVTELSRCN